MAILKRAGVGGATSSLPPRAIESSCAEPRASRFGAPPIERVIARLRLSEALDGSCASVVWVTAPAGAGKTLGVAEYVASRADLIWYEVGSDDRGPGTVVAELGLALTDREAWRAPPQLVPVPADVLHQESKRLFGLLLGSRRAPVHARGAVRPLADVRSEERLDVGCACARAETLNVTRLPSLRAAPSGS